MELILPSARYKDSFIAAVKEFQGGCEGSPRTEWYRKLSVPDLEADFEGFVERELGHARGENLPEGYVPYSTYWLVEGSEFIGQTDIRHELTPHLREIGGHIGYDIRPTERSKGYGNKILELALEKAKDLGITKILVTCDVTNIQSTKIIEKNGGVFENQVPNPETKVDKRRYWIDVV